MTDFIYPAAIPVLFPSTGAFSSNSYSIETSTCQLFLSVSFNSMTLTLQALGLSFVFRERSEMSVFQTVMSLPCVCGSAGGGGEEAQSLLGLQLSGASESNLLRQL